MGTVWELDFYSRPIVDEDNKKIWEVLVCESPLRTMAQPESLLRYAKFCPSTEVNSVWLRKAIEEAIAQSGYAPTKIRFFRRQMTNMIAKACEDLGIPAIPSRRVYALRGWLQERMQQIYPKHPNYQPGNVPSVQLEKNAPARLPDALIGQQWAFVSLEAAALAEMDEWEVAFGEAFPLQLAYDAQGEPLPPDAIIPGVIIFSPRALALAGWMSGIEPASLKFDSGSNPRLLLETGAFDSWILANIKDQKIIMEAKNFEEAKKKANTVHFIAVQSDPQAESFAGFWLMQELNLA
jgi:hypothetical protein